MMEGDCVHWQWPGGPIYHPESNRDSRPRATVAHSFVLVTWTVLSKLNDTRTEPRAPLMALPHKCTITTNS